MKYNKNYKNSTEEDRRRKNFERTWNETKNAHFSFEVEINKFADLDDEELEQLTGAKLEQDLLIP